MRENYNDILSRIDEPPAWYDQNGAPRYGPFTPDACPNIYSDVVVLMKIACQSCGDLFDVEMNAPLFSRLKEIPPSKWHYGDPPIHDCIGDTMNCDDLEVLQVWQRTAYGDWERNKELEGEIAP